MVSYEEVLKTLVGLGLKEIDAAIYLLAREKDLKERNIAETQFVQAGALQKPQKPSENRHCKRLL